MYATRGAAARLGVPIRDAQIFSKYPEKTIRDAQIFSKYPGKTIRDAQIFSKYPGKIRASNQQI